MSLAQVSVIMPTKNCRHLIEPNIHILQEWMEEAGELIIVDSESSDGTVDLLRRSFHRANVRFINRPPGLYAAWNHGIQSATKPLTYIATAGDVINRGELIYLTETVLEHDADVVISPPQFVNLRRQPIGDLKWPIHHLWENFAESQEKIRLHGADLLSVALKHARPPFYQSWLCSSSSNVYRTSYLQDHPFPEDAGHGGDTLFGIQNARHMSAVFCRRNCGTFVFHEPCVSPNQPNSKELFELYNDAYLKELHWLVDHNNPSCSRFYKALLTDPHILRRHFEDIEERAARIQSLEEKVILLRDEKQRLKTKLAAVKEAHKHDKSALKDLHRRIPRWVRRCFGA